MRASIVFGAVLALAAQDVLASILPKSEPRHLTAEEEFEADGFEMLPSSFTGDFGPNYETMTLNGTIEEVMAQVEEMRPGYINEVNMRIKTNRDQDGGSSRRDMRQGEDDAWRERKVARKDCKDGNFAVRKAVLDGVEYLYDVPKDTARLQARGCTRVSCSYRASIFLCWDPVEGAPDVYEKPWWYVGDYAKGIALEWCPNIWTGHPGFPHLRVRGKTWDPMGLAVHVRDGKC